LYFIIIYFHLCNKESEIRKSGNKYYNRVKLKSNIIILQNENWTHFMPWKSWWWRKSIDKYNIYSI